jgi:hypothetical protein
MRALMRKISSMRSDLCALGRIVKAVVIACVFSIALPVMDPKPATADEIYGFVQITCAPEIGYFAARRFQLINLPHDHPYGFPFSRTPEALARLSSLGVRYGIYDSILLQTRPLECDLPVNVSPPTGTQENPIANIRVVGVFDDDNGHATSERQIADYVEVFVGKTPVGRLFLNSYGFISDGTDSIELVGNGLSLRIIFCLRQVEGAKNAPAGCNDQNLKLGTP